MIIYYIKNNIINYNVFGFMLTLTKEVVSKNDDKLYFNTLFITNEHNTCHNHDY